MAAAAETKSDRDKQPYTAPKLTIHGDLRAVTAAKGGDRDDSGQPKTWNVSMP